ncbi:MAG: hypothetical protein GY696_18315 [Gammaproteobacteria bacterium]|nr:hypothetical protein [Gammaproteobacteria bacterium]
MSGRRKRQTTKKSASSVAGNKRRNTRVRQPIATVVEEGVVSDNVPETALPSSDYSPGMMNVLLETRNSLLDFQESVQKQFTDLKSEQRSQNRAKTKASPPALSSKAFAKQHEFNSNILGNLEEVRDLFYSDPAKAMELLEEEIKRLRARNSKLVMADRFPGSLSIWDSLEELEDLKKNSDSAPMLSEVLQLSLRGQRSSNQPFPAWGRGQGAPSYQSSFPRPPFQLPANGNAPYYANRQQGIVLYSGDRAPRRVVGPCNHCGAYGHLQRDCEIRKALHDPRAQRPPFPGFYDSQRAFPSLPALTAPPAALMYPGGAQGSFQPGQGSQ